MRMRDSISAVKPGRKWFDSFLDEKLIHNPYIKKFYQEKNLPEEKLGLFFPFYFVMSQMSWRPISQNDQTHAKNIPANAAWFLTCVCLTNL